ncbi:hypothetical protein [Yersinia alsatica]|nr:hypothetical protein [Yersinia alsatica]
MLEIEVMALSGVAAAAMTLFLPQAVWLLFPPRWHLLSLLSV